MVEALKARFARAAWLGLVRCAEFRRRALKERFGFKGVRREEAGPNQGADFLLAISTT